MGMGIILKLVAALRHTSYDLDHVNHNLETKLTSIDLCHLQYPPHHSIHSLIMDSISLCTKKGSLSFPTTLVLAMTVTNYHKFGEFKQHRSISHCSKSQKSEIQVASRLTLPMKTLRESSFLASSSFLWLLAFLGLRLHHCNLSAFSHCFFLSFVLVCQSTSFSLIKMLVMSCRAHLRKSRVIFSF